MSEMKVLAAKGSWRLIDAGDGVAVLEFDVPGRPVNVLSRAVLEELEAIQAEAAKLPEVKALVVASGKRGSSTFIAGADIDEIRSVSDPAAAAASAQKGQGVLGGFSRMAKPVVAAINGVCLGGGTELALACDLRIAADDPAVQIGLPEVLLGIFPGFGGSQRLPRLIGVRAALDLILTGKRIDARKAASLGLVDRLASPLLLREGAIALAREAIAHGKRWRPSAGKSGRARRGLTDRLASFILDRTGWGRSLVRKGALKKIAATKGGENYPAPPLAVRAVIDGMGRSLEDGLRLEAELVGGLVASEVAKNLIAIFQESEAIRRGPRGEGTSGSPSGSAAGGSPHPSAESRPPRRIAVLGAGVMGGGIAALLVRKDFRVRLKDIKREAIQTALQHAGKAFDELVARRRMTRGERENALAAISATTENTGLGGAETVLEAVVEDLAIKRKVLQEVEPHLGKDAIFASNTSALSITALQEAARDPSRVVGLHFFNPVHKMPLVEIVYGARTSPETIQRAEALSREIGKYPVRCKDGPGFLVNRLLLPYLNEAAYLFSAGASMVELDRTILRFGFPMGPFELLDEVGLDVAAKVAHILHDAFGERAKPAPILELLSKEKKLLGKKGGAGFYLHQKGKRGLEPNPQLLALQKQLAGASLAPHDPAGWERRMLYPMVNEAARCLDEGIVERPEHVNVATVFGMAFPPFRGGLLTWADRTGLKNIRDALEGFASAEKEPKAGERYRPAGLLGRLAVEGKGLMAFQRAEAQPEPALARAPGV